MRERSRVLDESGKPYAIIRRLPPPPPNVCTVCISAECEGHPDSSTLYWMSVVLAIAFVVTVLFFILSYGGAAS